MTLADYVRQSLEVVDKISTNEYAFKSFLSFVGPNYNDQPTSDILICWIATLYMKGLKAVSVKRYLCRLHVAYQEWLKASLEQEQTTEDPFEGLLEFADSKFQIDLKQVDSNLGMVKKLVTPDGFVGGNGKWRAIFFYLLYNPEVSFEDIAGLTFDSVPKYCPQTVEIVESMDSSHGRKYVFELNQADKRVPGIVRDITENVNRQLSSFGMKFPDGFSRGSITAIWISAAFRAGVKVEDIKAIVSVLPNGFDIINHVSPSNLTEKEKHDIICRVADSVNDITTRWYVLNMRNRIAPDDVKTCIKDTYPRLYRNIRFFYPTHFAFRESRRKKLVRQEVPFLPGLLFLKVRSDMADTLFSKITSVAWAYKYTNTPESPYSVISQKAMTDFQRHIGVFSDDVKVELVKTAKPFEEGQDVRILRGDLFGKLGKIESLKDCDGDTFYTIQITEDTAVKITVRNLEGMYIESAG